MKHVGDLGNLDFMAPASEEWPKNIPKCNKSTLAAYGLFNHIDLFG